MGPGPRCTRPGGRSISTPASALTLAQPDGVHAPALDLHMVGHRRPGGTRSRDAPAAGPRTSGGGDADVGVLDPRNACGRRGRRTAPRTSVQTRSAPHPRRDQPCIPRTALGGLSRCPFGLARRAFGLNAHCPVTPVRRRYRALCCDCPLTHSTVRNVANRGCRLAGPSWAEWRGPSGRGRTG